MFDLTTSIFAICFFVGLLFSVISMIGGVGHLGAHVGGDAAHLGHLHVGHSDGGVTPANGHDGPARIGDGISFLNLSSLIVFITWFGATGLCLKLYGGFGLGIILIFSCIGGVIGAYIVYLFLARFLLKGESKPLSTSDTYMPGTVAKVTSRISAGGTGEIVYVHLGTRRSCGAKSLTDSLVAKGTQVVIVKYEKGIAYVKPCSDLADYTN